MSSPMARFKSLLARARQAWLRGVITFVVGVILSFAATKVIKPIYRSETVLLYREQIRTSETDEREVSMRVLGAKLKEMLLARSKLDGIMDQFKLYPKERAKDPVEAVQTFRGAISFHVNENTFSLAYDADSAELAKNVTGRLAEGLVEESSRLRLERAQATKEFLEAQKKRNDEALKVFEKRHAQFVAAHPEFQFLDPTRGQGGIPLVPGSGGGSGSEPVAHSTAVERQAARIRERLASGGVNRKTEELRSAEEALASAEHELKEVQRRFTENHPDVVAARAKVATARVARDHARANQPAPLTESERSALLAQLRQIEGLPAGAKVPAAPQNDLIVKKETEWASITRDLHEARERNKQLEDKLFKATIALNVETGSGAAQLVVVDPPYLPVAPIRNSAKRVVAAGIGISIVLAIALMLLAGRSDDRLYGEADVEALGVGPLTVTISCAPGSLNGAQG